MLWHLTAHAFPGLAPFATFAGAAFGWNRLRAAFPEALGAMLMPDHPHLILDVDDIDAARRRLAAVLGGLTRSPACGCGTPMFRPVPAARAIADVRHLRRTVRYLALNPCREGLCRDPLSWLWSTHRDVIGAVVDPWVTAARLADALRLPRRGFAVAHHAYISGDPSVDLSGTPFPRPAPASAIPIVALGVVRQAVALALRGSVEDVGLRPVARRLFVQLARQQGWRQPRLLAEACGVTPGAVRLLAARPGAGLAAAQLCLGDPRLLTMPSPIRVFRESTAASTAMGV
ncbi:MAG TPA: hypothetical protein VGQ83_19435 [Polyangia bacterium]